MSWYVSLILPDILGPVLYLCVYLLVFAPETLTHAERLAVALSAWWAVASHATHLILAVGLCALLTLLLVLRRQFIQRRWKVVGEVAIIVLLAAAYLYGEPSLNGEHPPFLLARVIADGPGRWYLELQPSRTPGSYSVLARGCRTLIRGISSSLLQCALIWASLI